MAATALRWVVGTFGIRAVESGHSKEREKERWTEREGRAFLASFLWQVPSGQSEIEPEELPQVSDRYAQMMAQTLMAIECIDELAQILLLSDRVPAIGHLLSGSKFHSFLTGIRTQTEIPEGLWPACKEGLEGAFVEEKKKKPKQPAKTKTMGAMAIGGTGNGKQLTRSGGLFGLLGDLEE